MKQALDETAQLAERVYPALLNARGLAAALRSAVAGAGIRASVDVQPGANYPPEVAGRVYLCCLQALERVGAGVPVTITVREAEGALRFEVVEDVARSTAVAGSDAALDVCATASRRSAAG